MARERLMPEITREAEPEYRSFLDLVPVIRKFNQSVVEKQVKKGERLTLPLPGRELTVYLHRAPEKGSPVVFEYHGGGYVFGSAATDDGLCSTLRDFSGCNVVSVDYRLSPEEPYPAPAEDAFEALKWFHENGERYGIDPERMAVMGFSAGGNLAAVTALRAAMEEADYLKAQILHYPFLDYTHEPEEKQHFDSDVDPALIHGFARGYLPEKGYEDPLVSPICADPGLLAKVCPALIVPAEKDALCQEARYYHALLSEAGVDSKLIIMPGVHHGYIEDAYNRELFEKTTMEPKKRLLSPDFPARAEEALRSTAEFLRKQFQF